MSSTMNKRSHSEDESESNPNKNMKLNDDNNDDFVSELFNQFKNDSVNQQYECDDDSYITIEDFNNVRLNVIQQNIEIDIQANLEKFEEFLRLEFSTDKVITMLKNASDIETKYNVLYGFLVHYFTTILKNDVDVFQNIMYILKSIVVFKDRLKDSPFVNKINGIVKGQANNFDINKMKKSVHNYLYKFMNKETPTTPEVENVEELNQNSVFVDNPDIIENLKVLFELCNKFSKIGTYKTMKFKQMISIKAESREMNTKSVISKPARRIQLQSPILLKLTTKIISDGITIYVCDEEAGEYIIEKIKKALFFHRKGSTEQLDVKFYPSVNVGELKKMNTLKMYDATNKPVNNTIKDNITSETYILVNSFNVIYNENGDKFGISIKCWPIKSIMNDGYGTNYDVHVLDFNCDSSLFNFINQ